MSSMKETPQKKVLVSISLQHASGRDLLSGIFRHLETSASLHLKLLQSDDTPLTAERIRTAENEGVAGLIVTNIENADVANALLRTKLPLVLTCIRNERLEAKRGKISFIRNDNTGIGTLGAEYFLKHGRFCTFAFVHAKSEGTWDNDRCTAFCNRLSREGVRTRVFRSDLAPGSDRDIAELASWLTALPKPAAVMASCDWRGEQVLSACEAAGIGIPEKISLLGVDNDEFVCQHSSPPLSSILPGHEEMGRRAAEELERLILSTDAARPAKPLTVHPVRIVERASSAVIPPSAALVERARLFIRDNADKDIGVMDVVRHLRVSRRLAELRFKAIEGQTIREAIESTRFARLKRKLTASSRPIAEIAAECGFRDANALAHLFKKRTGTSMRAFRTASAAAKPIVQKRQTPAQPRTGKGKHRNVRRPKRRS